MASATSSTSFSACSSPASSPLRKAFPPITNSPATQPKSSSRSATPSPRTSPKPSPNPPSSPYEKQQNRMDPSHLQPVDRLHQSFPRLRQLLRRREGQKPLLQNTRRRDQEKS